MAKLNTKNVYIVLSHKYIPSKVDDSKWEVTEQCEFLSNLKVRHYSAATCIIHLTKERLIKNRGGELTDESYKNIMEHVRATYPNEVEELEKLISRR